VAQVARVEEQLLARLVHLLLRRPQRDAVQAAGEALGDGEQLERVNGFRKKASAPAAVAATSVPPSDPVRRMIGMSRVAGSSFSSRQSSRPVVPGMFTSSTITPGREREMARRASAALAASTTSTSATSKVVLSNVRSAGSSSTSRIRKIRDLPCPYLSGVSARAAWHLSPPMRETQPRGETCALTFTKYKTGQP
jgi:hypothetical protein